MRSKEKDAANHRRHYQAHSEEVRAKVREYRLSHKEEIAKRRHAHYLANKTEINLKSREYQLAHKEEINARRAEYYKANRAEILAAQSEWNAKLLPLVYRWYDPESEITAYVGHGTKRRSMAHKHMSSWWTPNLVLQTQVALNEWHAMELEGRWGRRYQPLHNKDGYRR